MENVDNVHEKIGNFNKYIKNYKKEPKGNSEVRIIFMGLYVEWIQNKEEKKSINLEIIQ